MSEETEHEKLVAEKVKAMDEAERLQTEAVREEMLRFLKEHKGYDTEDIEIDAKFRVGAGDCIDFVSTDYILLIGGQRFVAVKCAAGSVDSRERHIVAFSRVVNEYQIPFCLVTDGENTRFIDTIAGEILSEDLFSLPTKEEALTQVEEIHFHPFPAKRLEREKRILLAFEAVRCQNSNS